MQWLFDIVLDMVADAGYALKTWVQAQGYLTTGYIDRGIAFPADFVVGNFIKDATWHDMNLSSVVPEHAKAVALRLTIKASAINKYTGFRKKDTDVTYNMGQIRTQVADIPFEADLVVACDTNRFIQYKIAVATWAVLNVTVKGWWF